MTEKPNHLRDLVVAMIAGGLAAAGQDQEVRRNNALAIFPDVPVSLLADAELQAVDLLEEPFLEQYRETFSETLEMLEGIEETFAHITGRLDEMAESLASATSRFDDAAIRAAASRSASPFSDLAADLPF